MVRVDKIRVEQRQDSQVNLLQLQQNLEKKIQKVATIARSKVGDNYFEIFLEKPISFQTMNQIFLNSKLKIKDFHWKMMKVGVSKQGILDITIS